MTVCVDSSVALKWVLPEEGSQEADALLAGWRAGGTEMVAPANFFVEVASVLRQRTVHTGVDHLELAEARRALAALLGAGVTIRNQPQIHRHALDLAAELSQPTTGVSHYLALAEFEGCEFWTADEQLYRAVTTRLPYVRWLGEMRA